MCLSLSLTYPPTNISRFTTSLQDNLSSLENKFNQHVQYVRQLQNDIVDNLNKKAYKTDVSKALMKKLDTTAFQTLLTKVTELQQASQHPTIIEPAEVHQL